MAKDAQAVLDNPEMSVDDILESGMVGANGEISDVEPVVEETAEAPLVEEEEEEEEAPVLAADGKHPIPYNVLKDARGRAKEFQELYEDQKSANELLAAQVAKLTERAAAGGTVTQQEVAQLNDRLTDIDPEYYTSELGEEVGALARALIEQRELSSRMSKELDYIKRANSVLIEDRSSATRDSVNEVIDGISDLAGWRDNDPDVFDRAIEFDKMLMQDPKFKGASLEDRFAKATEMTKVYFGMKPSAASNEGNDDEIVDQKIAAAKGKRPGVVSLSQIKGGEREEVSTPMDAVSTMSTAELHKKMEDMTPAQIEKYLNNLG